MMGIEGCGGREQDEPAGSLGSEALEGGAGRLQVRSGLSEPGTIDDGSGLPHSLHPPSQESRYRVFGAFRG